ncbi:MAG: 2OG-Fe(II) oxygenase [Alphaproteobacteria bacterium]|nr:2OG-Fe(II) oxygenase [Alphaproteobacteria bacterium]
MAGLNWDALEAAPLHKDPFDYIHVPQALDPQIIGRIPEEFPDIEAAGSFSLADAPPGPVLNGIIAQLQSDRFRRLMADKFGIDLSRRATTVTIRGQCGKRDGFIHTDSKSKILSLLLYLNDGWTGGEGQLRLLRGEHNLEDYAAEIPASMGSLVVFRRSDASWHGHTSFIGRRRVLQFNYVRTDYTTIVSMVRHRLSALVKPRIAA